MAKIYLKTENETLDFAKKFARSLSGGEVIALNGVLGAGKTVFTKGLGNGLDIDEIISSPTFVVMKIYPVKLNHSKIKRLVHIDAYRLRSDTELQAIGVHDYLGAADTVVVIEWPDKVKNLLPDKTINIDIAIESDGRAVEIH